MWISCLLILVSSGFVLALIRSILRDAEGDPDKSRKIMLLMGIIGLCLVLIVLYCAVNVISNYVPAIPHARLITGCIAFFAALAVASMTGGMLWFDPSIWTLSTSSFALLCLFVNIYQLVRVAINDKYHDQAGLIATYFSTLVAFVPLMRIAAQILFPKAGDHNNSRQTAVKNTHPEVTVTELEARSGAHREKNANINRNDYVSIDILDEDGTGEQSRKSLFPMPETRDEGFGTKAASTTLGFILRNPSNI